MKQYEQETNLDIVVLVDCSASMRYGSMGVKAGWGGTRASGSTSSWTKFDHATATATAVAWMCLQQSDRVGLSLFSNGIKQTIGRTSSIGHWRRIVSVLSSNRSTTPPTLNVRPNRCFRRSPTDHSSSSSPTSGSCIDPILHGEIPSQQARRHCLQVLDHQEIEFDLQDPSLFLDMESDDRLRVDPPAIRDAYIEALASHQEEIRSLLTGFGFDHHLLDSREPVGPALARVAARRSSWLKSHHGR